MKFNNFLGFFLQLSWIFMKFFYLKKSKKMLKKFQKLKLIILRIETNFSDFSIILKPFGDF